MSQVNKYIIKLNVNVNGMQYQCLYLEGLFVNVDIISDVSLLGFTEENEVLEQEDVAVTFLLAEGDQELILTDQLSLLLQIDLPQRDSTHKESSMSELIWRTPL